MSYSGVVSIIKAQSEVVNPTGLFQHSNNFKASLNFSEVDKQIYLYPITLNADVSNHYNEIWDIMMGFYFQDAPDSKPEEQEVIVNEAHTMIAEFIDNMKEVDGIDVWSVRVEPSYRQMSGVYTGAILSFKLNTTTNLCAL